MRRAIAVLGARCARRAHPPEMLSVPRWVQSEDSFGNQHISMSVRQLSTTVIVKQQTAAIASVASKFVGNVNAFLSLKGETNVPAPEGQLAIVFTDVVKSTAIWESDPSAMTRAMQIHDEIIRSATSRYLGYEVKQNGDGFMIAFSTAVCAIQFCLSVQQQLIYTKWPEELLNLQPGQVSKDDDGNVLFKGLRLRMSAHWGEPVCNYNDVIARMDYLGPMVNRAARFIEVSEGGQIVVSDDFLHELQKAKSASKNDATGDPAMPVTAPPGDELNAATDRKRLAQLDIVDQEEEATKIDLEGLRCGDTSGEDDLPSDRHFELRSLGKHNFKGIEDPQKLYFIIPYSLRGRMEHWPRHYHVPGSKGNLTSGG